MYQAAAGKQIGQGLLKTMSEWGRSKRRKLPSQARGKQCGHVARATALSSLSGVSQVVFGQPGINSQDHSSNILPKVFHLRPEGRMPREVDVGWCALRPTSGHPVNDGR